MSRGGRGGPHGLILLDKPYRQSSNSALQGVKRLYRADRAGHTGALDPLATGMLPICLGEATKIAGILLEGRKAYRATIAFGATTTTADLEGEVSDRRPVPTLADLDWPALLARFTGQIVQRPPAHSAIKVAGRPLYLRARRGEAVEAPERVVEIHRLDLASLDAESCVLEIECGSGTYIRSLAVDLGEAIGCGAHLAALRRSWVAPFQGSAMFTLEQLAALREAATADAPDPALLPIDAGLATMPVVALDDAESARTRHGHAALRPGLDWVGPCRMVGSNGVLLALADRDVAGVVQPRRIFLLDGP